MKNQLVNTARISISNFTFDSKTNTISFYSTKTNKCWSRVFGKVNFGLIKDHIIYFSQKSLSKLKKLIKNGNN